MNTPDETPESDGTELMPAAGQGETEVIQAAPPDETALHQLERAYLLCISGPLAGSRYQVRFDKTNIGRDEKFNHVILPKGDLTSSKMQAVIQTQGSRYIIYDKRSRNRTFVNRHRLKENEEFALNFGDEIETGASIFRFVREGQFDWRLPVKAGTFLARRGGMFLLIATIAVALVGGYFAFGAFRYVMTAGARPGQLRLDAGQSQALGVGAAISGFDYNYAPALAWIPRLGRCGIALVGTDGRLTVYDGRGMGQIAVVDNRLPDPGRGLAVGDVNGDGADEVIFATTTGSVATINPGTGIPLGEDDFLGVGLLAPAIGDADGDGISDAVALSRRGASFLGRGRASGFRFEQLVTVPDTFTAPPSVADIDGDGRAEIVAVSPSGNVFAIDGSQRSAKYQLPYPRNEVDRMTGAPGEPQVYAEPTFCQSATERGRMIVWADYLQGLVVASSVTGQSINAKWAVKLAGRATASLQTTTPHCGAPVSADINGDRYPDVIVATAYGQLVALDGTNGKLVWEYYRPEQVKAILAQPALYDFDKDGVPDVVFGDDQGAVHIVSGRTGNTLAEAVGDGKMILSSPLVGDVNGDGNVDVVVEDSAGTVTVFATNSTTPEPKAFWPMQGGTSARDNVSGFAGFDTRSRLLLLAVWVGVLLAFICGNVVIVLVRRQRQLKLEQISES